MRPARIGLVVALGLAGIGGAILLPPPAGSAPVAAQGVGNASWTPAESTTTHTTSRFFLPGDSITFRTDAVWDQAQVDGLARYTDDGLRYTHEINDRSDRLSATGYWATNHPDPAYDRDDDDEDGRWEEAEIIAGSQRPDPSATYTSLVQFTRWHPKRQRGSCDWAWDRRRGRTEVLSQLSRDLFGEWQAERFTLNYDSYEYPRVDARPELTDDVPAARCREPRALDGQASYVATFAEPLSWEAFRALPGRGVARWMAFEAIGSSETDDLTWTCGGPVTNALATRPCGDMGMAVEGVVAAIGYLDGEAVRALRDHADVAHVGGSRDSLTDLLFEVGGLGVQRPGLTINDRYWELFLND